MLFSLWIFFFKKPLWIFPSPCKHEMRLVSNRSTSLWTCHNYLTIIVILKKLLRKVCQKLTFFLLWSFFKTPERKSRVKEANISETHDKCREGIHQAIFLLITLPSAVSENAFSQLWNTIMAFNINFIFLIFGSENTGLSHIAYWRCVQPIYISSPPHPNWDPLKMHRSLGNSCFLTVL